jgi:adenosyl cobinamide kinase/adenosyl cobinamide phosphate guanylyltransferase
MMERLHPPITYVATLHAGSDPDLSRRVAHHRQRRPVTWRTVEAGLDLPAVIKPVVGSILLDSLGPWVAAHGDVAIVDRAALCAALTDRNGDTVIVTEEVGLSVHPSSEQGRHFRDALGELNQAVAAVADEVLFVVAGRALRLEAP